MILIAHASLIQAEGIFRSKRIMLKNEDRSVKFQAMKKPSFKGVEAILFDFEGTLVDFQWDLNGAVQETLKMLRKSGFPTDRLQGKKYSILMREAMEIAPEIGRSPDEVMERIGAIYDRYDEDALTRWTLRPKARDFIEDLKTNGIKTGLVSNVGKLALEKAFHKLNFDQLFDVSITRNDVRTLKPSGEGINLALTRLRIAKNKALYVGDSLDDIHATKEAGLKVIIILGGENSKSDLLSAGPDFLIQDFGKLIARLKEEFS
jgi:phosphoglycolate phosphatase